MTSVTVGRDFDMGRVVKNCFSAVEANLPTYLLIGLLFGGLPTFASGWVQTHKSGAPLNDALSSLVVALVQLAGSVLLQASVMTATINHLDGEPSQVGDWISAALRHGWRVLLVSLSVGLLVAVSSVAFVIPGLMLMVRWSVAVPAQVAEDLRVPQAMKRSSELTKGRRWAIFGLLLLIGVPFVIAEFTLIGLANGSSEGFATVMSSPATRLVVLPMLTVFAGPIGAAFSSALYHELRIGRAAAATVARVFD